MFECKLKNSPFFLVSLWFCSLQQFSSFVLRLFWLSFPRTTPLSWGDLPYKLENVELDNDNTPSLGEIEDNNGNSNKDKVQFQSSSDFFYNKQL
jgi:hypothetical protein